MDNVIKHLNSKILNNAKEQQSTQRLYITKLQLKKGIRRPAEWKMPEDQLFVIQPQEAFDQNCIVLVHMVIEKGEHKVLHKDRSLFIPWVGWEKLKGIM
jgi:hypothetical protein